MDKVNLNYTTKNIAILSEKSYLLKPTEKVKSLNECDGKLSTTTREKEEEVKLNGTDQDQQDAREK